MLVALTDQNEVFQLTPSMTKTELQKIRQSIAFYCPQCKQLVQLKIGQINIPHFAHSKNNACESGFSEGESQAHLLGKHQLFTFFQQRHFHTLLEPYLPAIKQRPDLLVSKGHHRYAIEFQCSRISEEKCHDRSTGFLNVQITPIWLLKTPATFKKNGLVKLSINHFYQQFMQQQRGQSYLLTYDIESQHFYYVSNLMPIHGQQFLGDIQKIPLTQQIFPFYVPKRLTKHTYKMMLMRYQAFREQFLHSRLLLSRKGVNDLFLRSLYELRLNRNSLPIFLGVPTEGAAAIALFTVEWQTLLFYFMHSHNLTTQQLNKNALPYFFRWANIPYSELAGEAVGNYILLLKNLSVEHTYSSVSQYQLLETLYSGLVAIG